MNVRKHLAGLAIFSFILGSSILINHFLTIPDATIPPRPEATPGKVKEERHRPVAFRVRQVSLDYANRKSHTELSLFRSPGQPAPETVWVMTTYFSPDSARAEDWTAVKEVRRPFAAGDGEALVVATSEWDLPPRPGKPGASYFARVYISAEAQGKFYPPDYVTDGDPARAVPVVIHWPDDKNILAVTAEKSSR